MRNLFKNWDDQFAGNENKQLRDSHCKVHNLSSVAIQAFLLLLYASS